MKRILVICIVLIVFFVFGCGANSSNAEKNNEDNPSISNISYINGIPCKINTVKRHINGVGSLSSCIIAEDYEYFSESFKTGDKLFLDKNGSILSYNLLNERKIHGFWTKDKVILSYQSYGGSTKLRIKIKLSKDTVYNELSYKKDTYVEIELRNNKIISVYGTLKEDFEIDRLILQKDSSIKISYLNNEIHDIEIELKYLNIKNSIFPNKTIAKIILDNNKINSINIIPNEDFYIDGILFRKEDLINLELNYDKIIAIKLSKGNYYRFKYKDMLFKNNPPVIFNINNEEITSIEGIITKNIKTSTFNFKTDDKIKIELKNKKMNALYINDKKIDNIDYLNIKCSWDEEIKYHENEVLDFCYLAEDLIYNGIEIKKGEYLSLNDDKTINSYSFSGERVLDVTWKGEGDKKIYLSKGHLFLDKNQKLHSIYGKLSKEYTYKGITFMNYSYNDGIEIGIRNENYTVSSIRSKIAKDTTINNKEYYKEYLLYLQYRYNKIEVDSYSYKLKFDSTINGIKFPKDSKIEMKDENIYFVQLSKEYIINDFYCSSGWEGVYFHDNNQLKSFILAKDTIINGIQFKADDKICLDEEGNLTNCE